MKQNKREFAALVRATLTFLQPDWNETTSVPSLPLPIKPEPKKKEPPPPWKLSPPPTSEAPISRFSKFFQPQHETTSIYLFALDLSVKQKDFLENVAQAISEHIGPTKLVAAPLQHLLEDPKIRLLIAPFSLLNKKFPEVQSHQYLLMGAQFLLPMEPIDSYLTDLDLKRELWNQLKLFPAMLQSS